MKSDVTITLAVAVLLVERSLSYTVGPPEDAVLSNLLTATAVVAAVRLLVLWIQTYRHAIRHDSPRHREIWGVLHFVGGPVASLIYYYASRIEWDD